MEFIGSKLIFNPLHVKDIMKEANTIFNPNCLNFKNPIDFSEYRNEGIDLGSPFVDCQRFYQHSWTFMNDLCGKTPHTQPIVCLKSFMEIVTIEPLLVKHMNELVNGNTM